MKAPTCGSCSEASCCVLVVAVAAAVITRIAHSDITALQHELLIEEIKFYRAVNEERERDKRERETELFLARRWGYPVPRRWRWWRR
jgi:hypothetical protein